MFKKMIFFVITLCGLSACYVVADDESGKLEVLSGAVFDDQLTVQVKSNGCTKAEHFEVSSEERDGEHVLSIMRIRPDRCRAMPRVIELQLPLPENIQSPFRLENPFRIESVLK